MTGTLARQLAARAGCEAYHVESGHWVLLARPGGGGAASVLKTIAAAGFGGVVIDAGRDAGRVAVLDALQLDAARPTGAGRRGGRSDR